MKTPLACIFLLILAAAAILSAGCTSTSPVTTVATAEPTAIVTPTEVPTASACGIENCHGIPLQCGANVAASCSSNNVAEDLYASDQCRKYASCQIVGSTCQAVTDSKYDKCVSCIKNCENSFPNNQNQLIDCSQSC